ncbi:hypothetical protein DL770_009153 [Monosporascus sp. CRB-9-2]|nr:hypothetical protein DL770_009153 [Monosporascus sp. CRB-9-2]
MPVFALLKKGHRESSDDDSLLGGPLLPELVNSNNTPNTATVTSSSTAPLSALGRGSGGGTSEDSLGHAVENGANVSTGELGGSSLQTTSGSFQVGRSILVSDRPKPLSNGSGQSTVAERSSVNMREGRSQIRKHWSPASSPDLYRSGIDAHRGGCAQQSQSPLAEAERETPPPDEVLSPSGAAEQHRLSYTGEKEEPKRKRKCQGAGSSSHRRESSVKPTATSSTSSQTGSGSGILDTLRRYSRMPLVDQGPEDVRRAAQVVEEALLSFGLGSAASRNNAEGFKEAKPAQLRSLL